MQQYRLETNWLDSWGCQQQPEHEPIACPGSKQQQHPRLHHQARSQGIKRSDYLP